MLVSVILGIAHVYYFRIKTVAQREDFWDRLTMTNMADTFEHG